jgi:hypothetical protein
MTSPRRALEPEMDAAFLTSEDVSAMVDQAAQRYLNMSGEEFIAAVKRGEYPDPDSGEVMRVLQLVPSAWLNS